MTPWDVVGVLVVLLGLIGSVLVLTDRISKPVKDLTVNMATLTVTIEGLNNRIDKLDSGNEKEHIAIWDKVEEHDNILHEHSTEIKLLKQK